MLVLFSFSANLLHVQWFQFSLRVASERHACRQCECHILCECLVCILNRRSAESRSALEECYKGFSTTARASKKTRAAVASCPQPLSDEEFHACADRSLLDRVDKRPSSKTYMDVCRLRSFYTDAVFVFVQGDTCSAMRLLFCKQQPFQIHWLPVSPLQVSDIATGSATALWNGSQPLPPKYMWQYEMVGLSCADFWSESDGVECLLFMDTKFAGNNILYSLSHPAPFEQIHASLLRELATSTERKEKTTKRAKHEVSELGGAAASSGHAGYHMNLGVAGATRSSTSSDTDEDHGVTGSGKAETSDVAWQSAFETLQVERLALRSEEHDTSSWFTEQLLGGSWQVERMGRYNYGPRINAKRGHDAHRFLVHFRLTQSASFDHNVYGQVASQVLSRLWRHKVTELTLHWLAGGCPSVWEKESFQATALPKECVLDESDCPRQALTRRDKILSMMG
eukprot:6490327-Amphidinium_carterae.2